MAFLEQEIEQFGFAIVEGVLSEERVLSLTTELNEIAETTAIRRRGGIFAVRNLLDVCPSVRPLSASPVLQSLVEPVLGPGFFPIRGILFDKIPGANWLVPWHQDVTIALREKVEAEGFGPWSIKAGVHHVQPPAHILRNMLTVRLHLDPCTEENGALHVIPGSHTFGKIPESSIPSIRQSSSARVCSVDRGAALLMRPLLLHASHPSSVPGHRRVIHLDFAAVQLPLPMRWFIDPLGIPA